MKNNKTNHIAVAYEQGKCVMVAKCKMADDMELARLVNEVTEHEQERIKENEAICNDLKSLRGEIRELKKEVAELKGEDYEEI